VVGMKRSMEGNGGKGKRTGRRGVNGARGGV